MGNKEDNENKNRSGKHPGHGHPAGAGGGAPRGDCADELTDISEKGAFGEHGRRSLDKRLFMQLLVFTGIAETGRVVTALADSGIESVLYENINDPSGLGLLTMSEDPDFFLTDLRRFINKSPLADAVIASDYTMFGRTYSIGYEDDLEHLLLRRSREYSRNKDWPWAIWYPLRRSGQFAKLSAKEQGGILREHGVIGRAFGEAGFAHDVRLASFGLDKNDNDFVIGLIGAKLYPLSRIVQTMRKTVQTSTYMDKLGPFFVGKAVWQSPLE